MELLTVVAEGFAAVEAPAPVKASALAHLTRWLTDPDFAEYRPQLEWMVKTGQFSGLVDRFFQILPFGTGGRRGAVGIGPNRMNNWTLGASVQGHCEYLRQRFPGKTLQVGLAYDVRRFNDARHQYCPELPNPTMGVSSRSFAELAAEVYAANGITAWILSRESKHFQATPELSYLIRYLGLDGGLNISASHNPPDDNGGKFYDERGAQPVPPDDQIMADLVEKVEKTRHMPWHDAVRAHLIRFIDDTPHQAYIRLLEREALIAPPRAGEVAVVFTPLHGVGAMTAMELLVACGFHVIPVPEQMEPNGQFPNVTKSPNPEVPESMDRAAALATARQADLVLATDPDADRLGAMFPDENGVFRFITGHQIAALLTCFKLEELRKLGRLQASSLVVRTRVTTSIINRMAAAAGIQVVDDLLVGFKYIAEVLHNLETHGFHGEARGGVADYVIGVEESHGVLVTHEIRDKDAAGAALLMAELVLAQRRLGSSAWAYLQSMEERFGHFCNLTVNLAMTGLEGRQQMARMLENLRSTPPVVIGAESVTGFEDLRDPHGPLGPHKGATDAASRNVLVFQMCEHARLVLRPSGTEPKAKAYVEVATPPRSRGQSDADWAALCAQADARAAQLSDAFRSLVTSIA